MTASQAAAIKRLQGALAACDKAGVGVFGMDDTLICFDWREVECNGYEESVRRGYGGHDAFTRSQMMVIRSSAYKGSGGW